MLTVKQDARCKLSWAPFYYAVSIVLTFTRLNYLSDNFNDKLWKKLLMSLSFGVHIMNVGLCLMGVLLPNDYDLDDTISCLIIIVTASNIILKCLTLMKNHVMLKNLNDLILYETGRNDKPWEYDLALKYHRISKWIAIKIIVLYTLTLISFIILPIVSAKKYAMPILIEIPGTNRSSHPGYEINYIIGAYSIVYGTLIEIGFDVPAFMQACFILFQLDRCTYLCKMIGDTGTVYNTQGKQLKLLRKCIKLHADIYKFINKVATVNTSVVALICITSAPLQTLLLYSMLLGSVGASPFLLAANTYHIFLYCFLGDVVSTKCREISNVIYSSKWYDIQGIEGRRMFLFFLQVSQCDMGFSASGLYKLSLETFTELMRQIYGAYAFLKEVL